MTDNTLGAGAKKQILCAAAHEDTCFLVSYLLKPLLRCNTFNHRNGHHIAYSRTSENRLLNESSQMIVLRRFRLVNDLFDSKSAQTRRDLPLDHITKSVAKHRRSDRGQDRDLAFA